MIDQEQEEIPERSVEQLAGGANPLSTFDDDDWMKSRGLSCEGRWMEFDDGHVPETILKTSESESKVDRLLAYYPDFIEQRTNALHVIDNVLPNSVVQELYETTRQSTQPWGDYVTMEEVRDYWKSQSLDQSDQSAAKFENMDAMRHHLSLIAVSEFLRAAVGENQTPSISFRKAFDRDGRVVSESFQRERGDDFWTDQDFDKIHGVAVWSLGAVEGSCVPYHLDYAEQVRYETNRIVPPALAGTLQCTPHRIVGGDYCAHMGGLDHYRRHGYKGIKVDNALDTVDIDPGWVKIPYKFNRLTLQSGHLPHLSTRIESLDSTTETQTKRVILGFNAFFNDIGPLVQRAPEHSKAFRRKVALQRLGLLSSMRNANQPNTNDGKRKGLSVSLVRANPSLAKLLVLAKRHKVKGEFRQRQADLDKAIQEALSNKDETKEIKSCPVGALMSKLGRNDGQFPSPTDVQVHLHQGFLKGKYDVLAGSNYSDSCLSPELEIGLSAAVPKD